MRPRLIAALAALVAAVGVVVWGLATAGQGQHANAGSITFPAIRPTPDPSPSATRTDPAVGMRLVFHQTFTAPLNRSVWGTCYPWAGQGGCTNFNNPENEWYLPSQVRVSGGALHLVARRAPTNGTNKTGQAELYGCRSGMISSYPGFRFQYGYVQMVAKIPSGRGLWSGLWLAAANLKWPPEIDLLELWGPPDNKAGVYFHPVTGPFSKVRLDPAMKAAITSGWHTFSILWTRRQVTWYIDDQPVMVVSKQIPHQAMYVIANLANYTKTGGCTGQVAIRSIDVWQN